MALLFFVGCDHRKQIIHYQYNGVKITRLNKGDKIFFSYGYSNKEKEIIKDASVLVDYTFDKFLFGFLLFHKNGTVEIISGGGGDYKSLMKNSRLFFQTDSSSSLDFVKKGKYDNLYQISDDLDAEGNRNRSFESNVKIIP